MVANLTCVSCEIHVLFEASHLATEIINKGVFFTTVETLQMFIKSIFNSNKLWTLLVKKVTYLGEFGYLNSSCIKKVLF